MQQITIAMQYVKGMLADIRVWRRGVARVGKRAVTLPDRELSRSPL